MPYFRPSCVVLAIIVLMSGSRSGEALQLGETEAQILARHGAPAVADHGRQLAMYYWPGWSVRLDFQGGKVARLTYKKNEGLAAADFSSLLQANGGAAHWRETSQPAAKIRQWARDDGASAIFDTVRTTSMTVQSGQMATVMLQPSTVTEPKQFAGAPAAATPAPAPEFFPDPQAAVAKPGTKLSEISVPSEPMKVQTSETPKAETNHSEASPLKASPRQASVESDRAQAEVQSVPQIGPPSVQSSTGEQTASQASDPVRGAERILAFGCMIFGVSGALFLLYKSLPRRADANEPPRQRGRASSRRAMPREICAEEFELVTGDAPAGGLRTEASRSSPRTGWNRA